MLTLRELLLLKVGGEAGEVSRAVEKCAAYSLEDAVPPGYKESGMRNIDMLRQEIIDLLGNWEIFADKCELDGITGLSLLNDTGNPLTGPEFYKKQYNGIDPVVLTKIKDRKERVFKTLDISIRTGVISSEEVYGPNIKATLKRGDLVFFRRHGSSKESLLVTEVRYYDPTLIRDDNYPCDNFDGVNWKFAVLREEPTDRLPHQYLAPNEVGLTLDWLATNKEKLHVIGSKNRTEHLLKIVMQLQRFSPLVWANWFRRLE